MNVESIAEWKNPNSEARQLARQTSRLQRRLNWLEKMKMLLRIHDEIKNQNQPTPSDV